MRLVYVLFLVVPFAVFAAKQKPADPGEPYRNAVLLEKALKLPGCEGMSVEGTVHCLLIRAAQRRVKPVPLSARKAKNGDIVREFVLAAFDRTTSEFHEVKLEIPVRPKADFQPSVVTAHDPPYRVERVAGTSFNKMRFVIHAGEKRLYAYAGKYLHVPIGTKLDDLADIKKRGVPLLYLAADEHLNHPDLARKGLAFVRLALERARTELRDIPSHARPGKSVSEVFSAHALAVLLANEQIDPDRMWGKNWETFARELADPLEQEAVRAVFVDFFVNGLDAYRYICSKAAACGPFQFTNRSRVREGKTFPGTYDLVRAAYPKARLDPDFRRGAEGFGNSAKAAMLLFDLELSHGTKRARADFEREPDFGLLYAAAAYNGGADQANRLARFLESYERRAKVTVTLATLPWSELFAAAHREKVLFRETLGYVRKHFMLLRLPVHPNEALPGASS